MADAPPDQPAPVDADLGFGAARRAEEWAGATAVAAPRSRPRGGAVGTPPRWNRDPKTGIEAPLEFGKLLDYRDADVVGDIKYLWEPNRHLHLVTLAQAWVLTGRRIYLEVLQEHLEPGSVGLLG